MDLLWQGLVDAFWLLAHRDPELPQITIRSLIISLLATVLAVGLGIWAGVILATSAFPGRGLVNAGFAWASKHGAARRYGGPS